MKLSVRMLLVAGVLVAYATVNTSHADAGGLFAKLFNCTGCASEPTCCEPEPVCCEPEPEPVCCEPEPEPVCCEPEPEPVCCEPEPEPVCCEPEPEPVCCEPEPEPAPCCAFLYPLPELAEGEILVSISPILRSPVTNESTSKGMALAMLDAASH